MINFFKVMSRFVNLKQVKNRHHTHSFLLNIIHSKMKLKEMNIFLSPQQLKLRVFKKSFIMSHANTIKYTHISFLWKTIDYISSIKIHNTQHRESRRKMTNESNKHLSSSKMKFRSRSLAFSIVQ